MQTSSSLYRKYRSQTFDELVGQEPLHQLLVRTRCIHRTSRSGRGPRMTMPAAGSPTGESRAHPHAGPTAAEGASASFPAEPGLLHFAEPDLSGAVDMGQAPMVEQQGAT